jgi:hypothetical protein
MTWKTKVWAQSLTTLIICVFTTSAAEARLWKNAEGTKAIEAEFVTLVGDNVTLKTPAGKEMKFPLTFLSAEDQALAKKTQTDADNEKKPAAAEAAKSIKVFDQFTFGEGREAVAKKAAASKSLTGGVADALKGRVGLSGAYFISIDGIRYDLHFEFDGNERLTEMSLQSDPYEPDEYDSSMKKAWSRLRESFIASYGDPTETTGFPPRKVITEGVAMSSDLWNLGGSRHIYLGTGMIDGKVSCVLRCSNKKYAAPVSEPEEPATE